MLAEIIVNAVPVSMVTNARKLNARFCVVTVELVLGRINVAAHQDMEEHSVKKHCAARPVSLVDDAFDQTCVTAPQDFLRPTVDPLVTQPVLMVEFALDRINVAAPKATRETTACKRSADNPV